MLLIILFFLLTISMYAQDTEKTYYFNNFYEVYPQLGNKHENKTDISISYDDKNLFVSVNALKQNKPYASVLGRDEDLDKDDYIEIIFDNFNQHNSAVVFQTNPSGTKRDFEVSENGATKNLAWNSFWEVETSATSTSWLANFKIPFSTLRFKTAEKIVLNFKVNRFIKSKNLKMTLPFKENVSSPDYNLNVSEQIEISDIDLIKPVLIKPYVTANYDNNYLLNSNNQYLRNETFFRRKHFFDNENIDRLLSNVGVDIKYKFNSESHADFTLNTDFSDVENDDAIINLSRYSLYLPEKREFFIENTSLFDFDLFLGNSLFYSRKVGYENNTAVPIIAGLRYIGASNKKQYGLMSMVSNSIDDIESSIYQTARFKQNIKNDDSFIGAMYTGKHTNSRSNYSFGLDGRYRLSENVYTKGYLAINKSLVSSLPYSYGILLINTSNEGYQNHFLFKEYANDFDGELGFVTKRNRKMYSMWNGIQWVNISEAISRFNTGIYLRREWSSGNARPLFLFTQNESHLVFNNGADIMLLFRYIEDKVENEWKFADDILIPKNNYKDFLIWTRFTSTKSNNLFYDISLIHGSYFGGKRYNIWPSLNYTINQNLNINAALDYNYFTFPTVYGNDRIEKTALNFKLNYSINAKTSIKILSQYNSESKQVSSNIRLRYNPTEGTDLYLVYNQVINSRDHFKDIQLPRNQTQGLIFKFSKTFNY